MELKGNERKHHSLVVVLGCDPLHNIFKFVGVCDAFYRYFHGVLVQLIVQLIKLVELFATESNCDIFLFMVDIAFGHGARRQPLS